MLKVKYGSLLRGKCADGEGKRESERFSDKECMSRLCKYKSLRVVSVSCTQPQGAIKKNAICNCIVLGKYRANINTKIAYIHKQ